MTQLHTIVFARASRRTPGMLGQLVLALALLPAHVAAQVPSGSPASVSANTAAAPTSWAPLGAQAVMHAELSKSVRPAFFGDDHTWFAGQAVELRPNRSQPDLLLLDGSKGSQIVVFQKSWIQLVRAAGAVESPPLVHESSRPAGALATGQKWTARMTAEQSPVDWCSDTRGQVEGDFEVGKPQPYSLTVNGRPQTLEVLPVVERGKWTRCVSGKRYTRMLYSPLLDAVLSMEFITYRTNGQPHEASFRVHVKEIAGAQPK